MDQPEIKYLGDVQRLSVKDGDRLVISVPSEISHEGINRLREAVEHAVPGVPVLVLTEGIKLGILGSD